MSSLQLETVVHVGTAANDERYSGPEDYSFSSVKQGLQKYDHSAEDEHGCREKGKAPSGKFFGSYGEDDSQ